jgi:hypothetical protein
MDMDRYSVAWGEHYTVTSPGPLGIGSILKEDDGETARVIEFEPMHRFSIEVDSSGHWALGSRSRLGHVLEPVNGGTRFTTWFEPDLKSWTRVLRPVLMPYFRRRKPIVGIKRYLEEGRHDRWTSS